MQLNQSITNYIQEGLSGKGNVTLISFQGISLKKDEFLQHVNKFATYLVSIGVKKGDSVGICLPNFPSAIVAFYAINKVGAVINVIHPLAPPQGLVETLAKTNTKVLIYFDRFYMNARKELMDNGIKVILSSATDYLKGIQYFGMSIYNRANKKRIVELPEALCDTPILEWYSDILKKEYPSIDELEVLGEDVCLYLQSGGTTGLPKTIEITNFALNSIAAKTVKLTGEYVIGKDSMLMVLPIFHGFGIGVCVHTVLAAALKIVMVPKFNAKKINLIIKREKVTHIAGVPAMYDKMTKCKNFRGKYLTRITNAYCGGDVLTSEIKERYDTKVAKHGGDSRLYEGYGLAEAISVCAANSRKGEKIGSVGLPLEGIRFKAVDGEGKDLESNNIGELCIAGDILMKGYYNENDSECIKVDDNGIRWLYTGDYGYIDEEGYVFFRGRKKRIVIISGINVFPYEIESVVNALVEISVSCAVATIVEGKKVIKLYVELNKGFELNDKLREKIVSTLKTKLMKYSIPKIIEEKKLPRTAIGKVDYRKLEELNNDN